MQHHHKLPVACSAFDAEADNTAFDTVSCSFDADDIAAEWASTPQCQATEALSQTQALHCPLHGPSSSCFSDNFAWYLQNCAPQCGLCGACQDSSHDCAQWAQHGDCVHNADFMAASCPAACGLCARLHDAAPPAFVRLWNRLLMPTVGFGTAGLGGGTGAAVAMALQQGVQLLDSAQAREWYREDLAAEVCSANHHEAVSRSFLTTRQHDSGYDPTRQLASGECTAAAPC